MTQIIRNLFAYPTFFLFQQVARRTSLFLTILIATSAVFLFSDYISDRLPGTLWNMSGDISSGEAEEIVSEVVIEKGDTLSTVLKKQNLSTSEIQSLIRAASTETLLSKLNIGQVLKFYYDVELVEQEESGLVEERLILGRMSIKIDTVRSVEFVRNGDNFVTHNISAPLKKLISKYESTINTSLIASLQETGISTSTIIKLVNAYSHQIDFQRQIKTGDRIVVITEKFVTSDNEFSHHGKILHASLTSAGTDYNIYLYSPSGKETDVEFFSEEGQSIKSSLLKTPIDVVRISGHFGYRKKHPIHGYGAMHKGLDFAASTGTPIYAAGDGEVQFAGWKSGYGRFVLVKHKNGLSTAYAHASKFAKNLKVGSKVKQGDIIAYVGRTGHATGPHLHYEVRVNGKQVNPIEFKSTPSIKLSGSKLSKFNEFKKQVHNLNKKLNSKIELTAAEVPSIKLY
jgi:murein DD-endopeptidase MepM/ murein hydrolase activator NlpD